MKDFINFFVFLLILVAALSLYKIHRHRVSLMDEAETSDAAVDTASTERSKAASKPVLSAGRSAAGQATASNFNNTIPRQTFGEGGGSAAKNLATDPTANDLNKTSLEGPTREDVGRNFVKVTYSIAQFKKQYPDFKFPQDIDQAAASGEDLTVPMIQGKNGEPNLAFYQVQTDCNSLTDVTSPISIKVDETGSVVEAVSNMGNYQVPGSVYACQFQPYLVDGKATAFTTTYFPGVGATGRTPAAAPSP